MTNQQILHRVTARLIGGLTPERIAENEQRAERAYKALDIYLDHTGKDYLLRDLLCDLRHWSTSMAVDFDEESRIGRDNYRDEITP